MNLKESKPLLFFVFLAAVVQPNLVSAAWDQSGYPARCSMYDVFNEEICITPNRTLANIGTIFLFKEENAYFVAPSLEGERMKVGYFDSLKAAQVHIAQRGKRQYSALIMPNDEVADAFGMSFYSTYTRSGTTMISTHVTKVVCSAIRGDLN